MTDVSSGTVVTLTATVTAGSAPVTPGLVTFCDASAAHCTDIHVVGTGQLTSSGTAVIKFRAGIGSHRYKAVFAGTHNYAASASTAAPLSVTGFYPTKTTFTYTGGPESYTVMATVASTGLYSSAPTGSVSFLDTSNSNSVLAQGTLTPGEPTLTLLNPGNAAVAKAPQAMAVADFNRDGVPDVAIADTVTNSVTVWLGNGDGTFTAAGTWSTGTEPYSMTVADFNSDGIPDLAVACYAAGAVTILLGNGDGTFTPTKTSPSVGSGASAIAAGDFNGDGIPDFAVLENLDEISVLLGNGDGTFSSAHSFFLPYTFGPMLLAVGDFNGDGILDLVTYSHSAEEVTVLLGKGDGSFPTTKNTPTPQLEPGSMVEADLNGDGIPDLVVSSRYSVDSIVLLGKGDGTFTIGQQLGFLAGIAIGDFNGDGIPDLAGNAPNQYEVDYFLGAGNGTFTTGPTFDASEIVGNQAFEMEMVASTDLNGDGLSDVAGVGGFADPIVAGSLVPLISTPIASSTAASSLTLGTGNHLVEASYPGDTIYGASTSPTMAMGPVVTTLGLSLSNGPYVYGQTLALTATLTPNSGSGYSTNGEPISFYNNGNLLGTGNLASGVASLTLSSLGAGGYSFTANYAGDARFLESNSGAVPATIVAATPAITWATPAAIAYGTALSAAQLDATASVPGKFSYSSPTGTILTAGNHVIIATFTPTDSTDYTTATAQVTLTVTQPPSLTSPTASPLSGSTAFTWSPGFGWAHYELLVGTTGPGSSNVYNSGALASNATSETVNIPSNGVTLFVRLYYEGNNWVWNTADYTFTEGGTPTPPALTGPTASPVSGSTLFTWSPGIGWAHYELLIGTTGPGSANIYNSGALAASATSETVTIPSNGVTLFVRINYEGYNWTWNSADYTFTEGGTPTPPSLTSPTASPVSGSTLFTWSPGIGWAHYELLIGTTGPGSANIYNSGALANTVTSEAVNIPSNGVTLFVRLYYEGYNWTWNSTDYTFTEGGTPTPPSLTSPTASPVSGSTAFTWSPGIGWAHYELLIGTTGPGSANVYNSGALANTVTSEAVNIPSNGVTLFVRINYEGYNWTWNSKDYTFTEGGTPTPPALTSPSASPVAGSTQFTWSPGIGWAHYELLIGTTGPGSANVYNSGALANTVTSETVAIPSNGVTLFVRINYEGYNWTWNSADYTFTEGGIPTPPLLTSPSASPVSGSTAFTWSPGIGWAHYGLLVGTKGPGTSDVYNSGALAASATSETVAIPSNGVTLYVRLLYEGYNWTWNSTDYTFTEAP